MKIEIKNKAIEEIWQVLKWLDTTSKLLKDGEYEVSIKRIKNKRTLSQNKLMWLWFKCIADETGSELQDIHDYYCDLFLKRGVTIKGKEVLVTGSTSQLDMKNFTIFMKKIQADASAELGIILPLPEDLNYRDFIQYYSEQ